MRSPCVSVYTPPSLLNFWMPEPVFMKLGIYVYHCTWAYLNGVLHKCLSSVCLSLSVSPIDARKRLSNDVTAAKNTHATIKELLDALFSMRSVTYQKKEDD
jgi:hypothetical protein